MSLPKEEIEDFLDHVCLPLVGVVPYVRRQGLKAELRDLIETRIEDGASIDDALRDLGDPYEAGRRFQAEWEQEPDTGRRGRWLRIGVTVALGHFGTISAIVLLLLLAARYENAPVMGTIGAGLCWLGPLAAIPLGWFHPAHASKNAALATTIVGLHAALVALVVGVGSGAFVRQAALVFVLWLPVGSLVAWWSAEAGRRIRSRRFWRDHRPERSVKGRRFSALDGFNETRL